MIGHKEIKDAVLRQVSIDSEQGGNFMDWFQSQGVDPDAAFYEVLLLNASFIAKVDVADLPTEFADLAVLLGDQRLREAAEATGHALGFVALGMLIERERASQ